MAINTAHKRFSIMLEPGEMGWPPSSGIDAADRAVMLEWYSGIDAAAPDIEGPPYYITGSLDPALYLTGSLTPTLAFTGSLEPTLSLTGSV